MNLEKLTNQVISILDDTATYIKKERESWNNADVSIKADTSLVTSIDKSVEERLVTSFGKLLPESDFLAEEFHNQNAETDLCWIIDPIDGTTNLVHNIPMYCISVALRKEGKTVLGIVKEISMGECFWTYEGASNAFLNKKPIQVSTTSHLRDSLIATGFPMSDFEDLKAYMGHFKYFMLETRGLRRLGSAALDLAYVACGRCDAFFEYNLKPWDVAAGEYIVRKAGGMVNDFEGKDNFLFGTQILASNGKIHKELLERFNNRK